LDPPLEDALADFQELTLAESNANGSKPLHQVSRKVLGDAEDGCHFRHTQ
jgi:hypothetical protein